MALEKTSMCRFFMQNRYQGGYSAWGVYEAYSAFVSLLSPSAWEARQRVALLINRCTRQECKFAHDITELRTKPNLSCTKICKWKARGT